MSISTPKIKLLGAVLALVLAGCGDDGDSTTEATLSPEQNIEQVGNEWAPLFAAGATCNRYMAQPVCERIACKRVADPEPIRNCTPPSPAFRKSFEDATVEDIAINGDHAGAKFSNGELLELVLVAHHVGRCIGSACPPRPAPDDWLISNFGGDAGKKYFEPLSPKQQIERYANKWAQLFADGRAACRYMGQPACERETCKRLGTSPIENCTPPSPEFRESFADATVERVVVEGHHATAEFSNGESVEFEGQKADEGDIKGWGHWAWFITERWIKNAGRA